LGRESEEHALARGFAGMRVLGNTSWINEDNWRDFREYEMQLELMIKGKRMIIFARTISKHAGSPSV
jgi:hypothetical protein